MAAAVSDWSVDEVLAMLDGLGLGHLREPFKENGVNGRLLVTMHETEFMEVGTAPLKSSVSMCSKTAISKIFPFKPRLWKSDPRETSCQVSARAWSRLALGRVFCMNRTARPSGPTTIGGMSPALMRGSRLSCSIVPHIWVSCTDRTSD